MITLLLRPPTNEPLANSRAFYESMLFAGIDGKSVNGYFRDVSRGAFGFRSVGVMPFRDNKTAEFEERAGVRTGDDSAMKTRRRARLLLADANFAYASFDTNGDGQVTSRELTILVIDRYSDAKGQVRWPEGCLSVPGVDVCAGVALVGHRSGFRNYAHELSHIVNPGSFDLYGENCLSQNLTLMSCTAGEPFETMDSYYLEPWHRTWFGWAGPERTVNATTTASGSQELAYGTFPGATGTHTLKFTGPDRQAVTFEVRHRDLNPYDDGVAANGVIAWYSKVDANGRPAPVTGTPHGIFSLAPLNCTLRPNHAGSRGQVGALEGPANYRLRWLDGTDSGLLITVTWNFILPTISWLRTTAAPSC